jgi:hypothetical protein
VKQTLAAFLAVACCLSLSASATAAREPSLRDVLARAAAYVGDWTHQIAGIAAEEVYVQTVEGASGTDNPVRQRRELRSDFLLVRMTADRRYADVRDVFEVDGQSVRRREDRLTPLFANPSARPDFDAIVAAGARYNLGPLTRTMNTPTIALSFLAKDLQPRFSFSRTDAVSPATGGSNESPASSANFRVSTEMWVVAYREKGKGTLIRTPRGRDLPAHGRLWIDPASGRVLMTELVVDDESVQATVDVSYQSEPMSGLLVPVEMRERYLVHVDGSVVTGAATYGKWAPLPARS